MPPTPHAVRIELRPGFGAINVNGVDITALVRRVEITLTHDGERLVRLDLLPEALELDLDGVEVYAEAAVSAEP